MLAYAPPDGRHRLAHDGAEVAGEVAAQTRERLRRGRRRGSPRHMRRSGLFAGNRTLDGGHQRRPRGERRDAGQELIEHEPEAVLVAGRADRIAVNCSGLA